MTSERTKKATDDLIESLKNGDREQGREAVGDWMKSIFADAEAEHEARHPDYVGECSQCARRARKKIEARAERDRKKRNA